MRCPNCQTNNPPNAKFCLECGTRLIICPNCGTANPPAAKFCIECGTPLQGAASLPAAADNATIPLQIVNAQPEIFVAPEERRIVTVMFADITNSTPLADRLEPEDMRAILSGYFNLMAEQIRKHGGTVEKFIGDAVMAVFGVPIAHEDDPARAIRAALDMQTALKQFNSRRQAQDPDASPLQMRIGINTGEVAAPGDTHQRLDFLITGDAVNVAARLQQAAAPDTILVGERTYLLARASFTFRAIAPLHLKGKPEPIPAYVVECPCDDTLVISQQPRGIDGHRAPLVGRSLELMLMHTSYARVLAERRPHLITILGVPGVGKTRLVRDFIAREQEAIKSASSTGTPLPPRVLAGRCPPYGEGITYWPLIEILRGLLGVDEDATEDELQLTFLSFIRQTLTQAGRTENPEEIASNILRRIGRGPENAASNTGSTMALKRTTSTSVMTETSPMAATKTSHADMARLQAWRVLLEALADRQPLIIVIDDLHWADDALLELLEYLAERITNKPILFLCPARPDFFERHRNWGGGKRNFTTIELEALSREEASELVDALLNTDDLPEVLRQSILQRAEGNPFFVEEIVRMLIDQGFLVQKEIENGQTVWQFGPYSEMLNELSTPNSDYHEDSLINMHYLLPLSLPDTIQGVLAARIDLLRPIEKHLLQHAAIIGREFWLSSLLELSADHSKETVIGALASLAQRDFLFEINKQVRGPIEQDRAFVFKHVLIRDVVYSHIPRSRRAQEHARLALWLEKNQPEQGNDFVELLAYHYQQALASMPVSHAIHKLEVGTGNDVIELTRTELRQRAVTYLTRAGDQALHSYYTVRAIQAYSDALDLLTSGKAPAQERFQMHIRLGDAYGQRHNSPDAMDEYRLALQLTRSEPFPLPQQDLISLYERLAVRATRWTYRLRESYSPEEIRSYIDAGLALLPDNEISRERSAFLTYRAFWYIRQLEDSTDPKQKAVLGEQAMADAWQALEMAEKLNDPTTLSLVLDSAAFTYSKFHRYNDVLKMHQRRLQLESRITDRVELYDIYHSLGYVYQQMGDYPNALMWSGRCWSLAQTMESPSMLIDCLAYRMEIWLDWNRGDEAESVAYELLQMLEHYQQQDEFRRLNALETLFIVAYLRGDASQADQYARQYQRTLDQFTAQRTKEDKRLLQVKSSSIALARGDWEQALEDYRLKQEFSAPNTSPQTLATLAELLVITHASLAEQTAACDRAVRQAEKSGTRKALAVALRARGRMYTEQKKWSKAEDNLRQALQRCEVLDLPWETAQTLYHLGQFYRRRAESYNESEGQRRSTDLGRARYHFEQALGYFEMLKAQPSIRRTRLALAQNGSVPA